MLSLPLVQAEFSPADLPAARVDGLYVHIPFCFHKCHYCDFYSITRQDESRMRRFVELMLSEAQQWAASRGSSSISPKTVFFGGGTPTLLPMPLMIELISGLQSIFDLSCVNEWTIEANPATVNADYCRALRETGIERLSFGAQSFDRSDLAVLERHHDPDDVPRSVEAARSAGFERLNVDLIYAVPGQTLESWDKSLRSALALGTPHLSCYGLTYEPNTPMGVKKRLGHIHPAAESLELQMFRHTRECLRGAGLFAYEISNFARPGEECRHNLMYWTGGNYIGLGPSAASHIEGWRWRNRPHLGEWERAAEAGTLAAIDVEHLSSAQRAGELAMLMLRLSGGIEFATFTERTGVDARAFFAEQLDQLTPLGLIHVNDTGISLSDSALHVADSIAAEFLAPPAHFDRR